MINTKEAELSFLNSALDVKGKVMSLEHFNLWVIQCRQAVTVDIQRISFNQMKNWLFDDATGNLRHASGKFFSIEGIEIFTNWGNVKHWTQPIINQPEIGFLGIITKKIEGVLHFLMQAKIEPGNINFVQISPTLQATKSNYLKVHKGKTPKYLEYFTGEKKVKVLLDQLQSEQGARFFKKRNRNIIVEIEEDIEVQEEFCWLTLGQLKLLMREDNLINMDTRTVLSGISFGNYSLIGAWGIGELEQRQNFDRNEMLISALEDSISEKSIEEIISWITSLKSKYDLDVERIPLRDVQGWVTTESTIHHLNNKYFTVIAANIYIGNREVIGWSQPLIESAQEGLIAFIVKKIKGIYHFLVQAKIEAGNFDILELAPTVQCLTGNYRKGLNEYDVPFISYIVEPNKGTVLYNSMQSEEGGRFFREQNLNMIIDGGNEFPLEIPENFCWMTLNQLFTFIKFNNYLNIQARSLLSAIIF